MKVFHKKAEARAFSMAERAAGRKTAFVPTMGALHEGHLSLVDKARELADTVIVSIFVNPTQFGPNEDFDKYPRTLDADIAACGNRGVAAVFAPSAEEMYPQGPQTVWVDVESLTDTLCGASRPGHFRGVATVVSKLFNIVQPDVAVFGEKDYQQALVIKRMAEELDFPVEIATAPTLREPDGLAMSSRNKMLTPENRAKAVAIFQALEKAKADTAAGRRDADAIRAEIAAAIESSGGKIDYVEIVDSETLRPLDAIGNEAVAAVAAKYGDVRLIDNATLRAPREPRN